jgi:hypothetical protein
MIFYTLQGPQSKLEIHDDKIRLTKNTWWNAMRGTEQIIEYKLDDLSQFNITSAKLIWGKLEWKTFDGMKCAFRFSTNSVMMRKIEKYMHKLVLKNIQREQNVVPRSESKLKMVEGEVA